MTPVHADTPVVQGIRLRAALKEARLNAGLTLERVADELDVSLSKIVRVESGAVKVSTTDLRAMLDLYKVTDRGQIAKYVSMAKAARQPAWWRRYRLVIPKRYLEYLELEQAAETEMNFQPQLIPGLLQTRDYASVLIRQLNGDITDERADELLEFRMERQNRLIGSPESPRLSFVLDESAVHRQVGSAETMDEQINHLIELAGWPGIALHILRFAIGPMPRMQAPFVIVQLPDAAGPEGLFLEDPRGDTLVVNDPDEVNRYRRAFEDMRQAALSGPDTIKFLDGLARGSQ